MNVLVIGSGGREHALVWKIAQSEQVQKVYCAPGNPGIAEIAEIVPIAVMDFDALVQFVREARIDLTVVGPEDPLVAGIVDIFNSYGLTIFGPDRKAAQLEGSKYFAKELMKKYHIPTAAYAHFEDAETARRYISSSIRYPVVVKASGLAAGKGVLICQTEAEALSAVSLIMEDKAFGMAGERVIVEEFLEGEEVSVFALSDGNDYRLLSPAQDHKKVFDGDKGKNTGGMGAYAPAPIATKTLIEMVEKEIIESTLKAMKTEGMPYKGLLYVGLIVTKEGPKVLEYNCRFGDPEAEVILPLIESDIVPLLQATISGGIKNIPVALSSEYALDVVLASGGYPDQYEKGKIINGLNRLDPRILVFHAGTTGQGNDLLTNGGRVLNIVARGTDFMDLREYLYRNIKHISFEGIHYRNDIGYRAIASLSSQKPE